VTGRIASPSSATDLSPDRFTIHRADTPGATIAFVHEGEGGLPLLLVHGWPETKRIWWRNVSVLAEAGFEVIAPDLWGFGDSGPLGTTFTMSPRPLRICVTW
jgi:pimeloyl-ACP methyl ester carboxylesterase